MRAIVALIAILLFLFYSPFIRPVFATVAINPISIDTSTPIIGDAFNLTASMSGALSGSNYYIKCRIGANTSSLNDGQTYNPQTSQWLDDTGSTGAWIDMPQITIGAGGSWQDSVKCRIKASANDETKVLFVRACLNSNNSCGTSFQSTNLLTVNPIFPTPTNTPTLAPTATLTPTPTSTPNSTPTPTKTLTPTPTLKISVSPTPKGILPTGVLGESSQNGSIASQANGILPTGEDILSSNTAKKPDTVFQGISMVLGIVLIGVCAILTFRVIKKEELTQDEEE